MNPRTAAAALASGVVISLTALSGGAPPASAKPDKDPGTPIETIMPSAPEPQAEAQPEVGERPQRAEAPEPVEIPQAPQEAPPVVQEAPPVVQEAPPVVQEAPPVVQAPRRPVVQEPPVVEQRPVAPAPKAERPAAAEEVPAVVEQPPAVQAPPTRQAPPVRETPVRETPPAAERPAAVDDAPTARPEAPRAEQQPEAAPSTDPAPRPAPADRAAEQAPDAAEDAATPSPRPDRSADEAPRTATPDEPAATDRETRAPSATAETDEPSTDETARPENAQRIVEVRPETLSAPEADVALARRAEPVVQKVLEAPKQELDTLSRAIFTPLRDRDRDWDRDRDRDGFRRDERRDDFFRRDRDWDRRVRQWNRDWVEYDRFYRPIFFNPYRDPVRIVYVYLNRPRVVFIPPLARIVLEAAEFAAYSFTAVVLGAADVARDVAVGTFFGGGYVPRPGLPLPVPPRLVRYDNVPVQVRYPQAVYQPFRVSRVVDMGDDPRFGERKVLLDGATPAWGVWTQNPDGERQFEVHRTQQFPGLDEPQAVPLPGDYPLRLAAEESSGVDRTQAALYAAAGAVAVLGFGAIGTALYMGRRRPEH